MDFHATFLELAGVPYPDQFNGKPVGPARGISLTPLFQQQPRKEHEELFYYFNNGKTALLHREWKLVDSKELYRFPADRIEDKDLSKEYPEIFEKMKARWAELAKTYKVGAGRGKGKKNKNKNKKKKE